MQSRFVTSWLIMVAVLVVIMIAVGGVTRLTESGLSMTNWHPITGWLPPLTQEAWEQEYRFYQTSPEYKHINFGMGVEAFKTIFWLEYIHRVLGRVLGLTFFIPWFYFAYKKAMSFREQWGLLVVGVSIVLQGVVGWLMVRSGLQDNPYVDPRWLAFHLGNAFIILGIITWIIFRRVFGFQTQSVSKPAVVVLCLLFVQILLGALVAGWDAGLVYNTFPRMNGQWVPEGMFSMTPWFDNITKNPALIQFMHRVMAMVLSFGVLALVIDFWRFPLTNAQKYATSLLVFALVVQFVLGVLTLVHAVPLVLASLHQLGAVVLLLALLLVTYTIRVKRDDKL